MELEFVLAYLLVLLALYVLVRLLYLPIRVLILLVYNGIIGGILLWVVNLGGQFFGFHIGLNPITAVATGLLGFPGVVGLIILRTFFS